MVHKTELFTQVVLNTYYIIILFVSMPNRVQKNGVREYARTVKVQIIGYSYDLKF